LELRGFGCLFDVSQVLICWWELLSGFQLSNGNEGSGNEISGRNALSLLIFCLPERFRFHGCLPAGNDCNPLIYKRFPAFRDLYIYHHMGMVIETIPHIYKNKTLRWNHRNWKAVSKLTFDF
jgi:hypothetical protein